MRSKRPPQRSSSRPAVCQLPLRRTFSLLVLAAIARLALAASTATAADWSGASPQFTQRVLPVLETYCLDCHGDGAREGGWSFDGYPQYADLVADQKVWGKAQQLLRSHVMPPAEARKPTLEQRRAVLEWIDEEVFYVDPARPDPGRTTLRRLNRAEYNNTVRDVLGVESRPADAFPPDDSGYGFDNIGDVLSLSPLHLEKYLAAAREVAAEAVRLETPPRLGVELTADKLEVFRGKPRRDDEAVSILLRSPAEEIGAGIDVPLTTTYKVFAKARPPRDVRGADRLEVWCDDARVAELALNPDAKGQQRVFALAELPAGRHRLALRVPKSTEPQAVEVDFLGVAGPFAPALPRYSTYLRRRFGDRPIAPPMLRLSGEDLEAGTGRSSLDTGKAWFASNGFRRAPVLLSAGGEYRFRFLVGAQQAGDEPVRFEIRLARQTLGPFEVAAGSAIGQWVEFTGRLPAGRHDLQVWFVNEYTDPETKAERWLWVHEFIVEGPSDAVRPLRDDEVTGTLAATARRLYRRPLEENEVARLEQLEQEALQAKLPPLERLQLGLEALLVSPQFLFLPRPTPAGDQRSGAALIDEFTLASRLSYFLWSSAPDEELLALAAKGQLRAELNRQVRRMLRDSRSAALTENFAGQWLQLRDLQHASPDPDTFPEFDPQLLADMRRESELLFEHILHENRSVMEFLDADYTFVNERLARHYGLTDVPQGEAFRRVELAGTPRGGVLTHGSILALTSHPTRTSPVKRGKWLLEQLLGTPPPPAPADVPPLPETRDDAGLPLRRRLEQHRDNPACASCHAFLDPMGFAMENYDAIGRWRERDGDQPIDAGGTLITGEQFADLAELRSLLVEKQQDDFRRCLTEHLLTYALGRGVTWRDKLAVREIMRRTEASENSFQAMILAVCRSDPLQRMRLEDGGRDGGQ